MTPFRPPSLALAAGKHSPRRLPLLAADDRRLVLRLHPADHATPAHPDHPQLRLGFQDDPHRHGRPHNPTAGRRDALLGQAVSDPRRPVPLPRPRDHLPIHRRPLLVHDERPFRDRPTQTIRRQTAWRQPLLRPLAPARPQLGLHVGLGLAREDSLDTRDHPVLGLSHPGDLRRALQARPLDHPLDTSLDQVMLDQLPLERIAVQPILFTTHQIRRAHDLELRQQFLHHRPRVQAQLIPSPRGRRGMPLVIHSQNTRRTTSDLPTLLPNNLRHPPHLARMPKPLLLLMTTRHPNRNCHPRPIHSTLLRLILNRDYASNRYVQHFSTPNVEVLKQYNDTFGHPAGDALLTRVGDRL